MYIKFQTEVGVIAGKVVKEDEDSYIVEFGGGKQYEVLKCEVQIDENGQNIVYWY